MVSLSGGEPKRIDDGVWPAVSAQGDLVAYIKRGQIWAAPLVRTSGGIAPGDPQQLIHDRGVAAPQGNATSLRWSPNERRLAFVSFREEHSFIGVYDADRRTLLFLDPPAHGRVRGLASNAFTPRRVEVLDSEGALSSTNWSITWKHNEQCYGRCTCTHSHAPARNCMVGWRRG